MDTSGLVDDCVSPESTVTSLLSSSGHLRTSLWPPENSAHFRYRDKVYDSATAALDAYITDFERCHSTESPRGRLLVPHNELSMPRKPTVATNLRNRDVLRERLTEKELDFLNLPVSSLHHRSNRDRLSMTTDELLSIPHDGSEPVTHTSAYIQGLLSLPGASRPRPSFPGGPPANTAHAGLSSTLPTRTLGSSRCKARTEEGIHIPVGHMASVGTFTCGHGAASSQPNRAAQPSSSLHLPHWLTSNKVHMDCSGMSSVPDLEYPAWVEHCNLSQPPPPSELESWACPGLVPPAAPRTGAPSWVGDLEKEEEEQTPAQTRKQQATVVGNQTLGELRLQFAEHISKLSAEQHGCRILSAPFTDSKMESLLQKADEVLTSLSQSSAAAAAAAGGGAPHPREVNSSAVSAFNKEGLQVFSPSCCPPSSPELREDLEDRAVQAWSCSTWKQPGPAEALKQMLFRLQAVEAELHRQQHAPAAPAPAPVQTDSLHAGVQVCDDDEPKLHSVPGRPSLHRALYHLGRLKLLVKEPAEYREEEEEEERE